MPKAELSTKSECRLSSTHLMKLLEFNETKITSKSKNFINEFWKNLTTNNASLLRLLDEIGKSKCDQTLKKNLIKSFWKYIKKHSGTPLIENTVGNKKEVLFLWKGTYYPKVKNNIFLMVCSKFFSSTMPLSKKDSFKNISGTNIYFVNLTLPADLLTTYTIYIQPKKFNILTTIMDLKTAILKEESSVEVQAIYSKIYQEFYKSTRDLLNPNYFNFIQEHSLKNRLSVLRMPLAKNNTYIPFSSEEAEIKLNQLREDTRLLKSSIDISTTEFKIDVDDIQIMPFYDNEHFEKQISQWKVKNLNSNNILLIKDQNDRWNIIGQTFEIIAEGKLVTDLDMLKTAKKSKSKPIIKQQLIDFLNNRFYSVYLPQEYHNSHELYPLLIQLDGQLFIDFAIPAMLDKMIYEKIIPPIIVIFFDSLGGERHVEYDCNDSFTNFLAKKFVPHLEKSFHCTHEAKNIIISGFSMGGLAAIYAGLSYPEIFGNVISQSGALWSNQEKIASQFDRFVKNQGKTNFIMNAGKFEKGILGRAPLLEKNREMVVKMRKNKLNHQCNYHEFMGDHNPLCCQTFWTTMLASIFQRK